MSSNNSLRRRVHHLCLYGALFLLSVSSVHARNIDIPPPADPYLSPQTDPYNPLKYIADNALTAVGLSESFVLRAHDFMPVRSTLLPADSFSEASVVLP